MRACVFRCGLSRFSRGLLHLSLAATPGRKLPVYPRSPSPGDCELFLSRRMVAVKDALPGTRSHWCRHRPGPSSQSRGLQECPGIYGQKPQRARVSSEPTAGLVGAPQLFEEQNDGLDTPVKIGNVKFFIRGMQVVVRQAEAHHHGRDFEMTLEISHNGDGAAGANEDRLFPKYLVQGTGRRP